MLELLRKLILCLFILQNYSDTFKQNRGFGELPLFSDITFLIVFTIYLNGAHFLQLEL